MAIPENELFEKFFSGTKIVRDKHPKNCIKFLAGRASGAQEAPVLFLIYPESELTLDAVLGKIVKELENNDCVADTDIALGLLGVIAETKPQGISAVSYANNCILSAAPVKLRQIVVMPYEKKPGYEIDFDGYYLRSFDPANLLYWAKKSNCGYPIDLNELKNCLSFEQDLIETKALLWDQLPTLDTLYKKWGDLANASILDIYYRAISSHYFKQMPQRFKEKVQVYEAGALMHFDQDSLISSLSVQQVDLFFWKSSRGNRGWAALNQRSIFHRNYYPSDLFASCKGWLKTELGFESLDGDNKFNVTISSYCKFLQSAQTHHHSDNVNDAYIHFVIALDLLLGIEGRSTESVCSRAALLVYNQLDQSFEKQKGNLQRLYSVRSQYVHNGTPIKDKDVEEIEKTCIEILWALLETTSKGAFTNTHNWHKQLDFLVTCIEADKSIPAEELRSVGIPPEGCKRIPPNKVQKGLKFFVDDRDDIQWLTSSEVH